MISSVVYDASKARFAVWRRKMVEEDRFCVDVLTQVSAVTSAMHSVAVELLDGHLRHCVTDAIAADDASADDKVREATTAISRLLKS